MDDTSDTPAVAASLALSPGFDRARRLSRILVVLLTVGFWLGIAMLMGFTAFVLSPDLQDLVARHIKHPVRGFTGGHGLFLVLHAVSALIATFYARRLFVRFADGDVFTPGTIGLIRQVALWIVIAGVLPPSPFVLIVGLATYIAGYVMAEAARIADDSASIV